MKTTYKFSEMLDFLSMMHCDTWKALDSYSDVPYITKCQTRTGISYLNLAETYKSVDSSETIETQFDSDYVQYQLESMQPEQRLIFPIYYGCNFRGSFAYKFSNNVFVLTSLYFPDM